MYVSFYLKANKLKNLLSINLLVTIISYIQQKTFLIHINYPLLIACVD